MNRNIKSHLALLGANMIYGINYVIAKGIMPDYMLPRAIILFRVSVVLLVLWMLQFLFPREKVSGRDLARIAICAIFGIAVNQIMFFEGLNLTTPINASIIITSIPVLVLIFSHFILKEKITSLKVIGIILGGTGSMIIILSSGTGDILSGGFVGNFFIGINATSYALYLVLIKPMMAKYSPITVLKWLFFFGAIIIFPFTFSTLRATSFSIIPVNIWFSIGFVVFGATLAVYFLNNYSLKTVSPSINGTYIYLQPFIASVLSVIFAKDHLTMLKIIASLLIMAGVFLVTRKKKLKAISLEEINK